MDNVDVRRSWLLLALFVLGVLATGSSWTSWRGPVVHQEEVSTCLSMRTMISCELSDGWTVAMPPVMQWRDANGTFHSNTRPECLPPTGRRAAAPVRVWWTRVEVEGRGWREVLQVQCLTSAPGLGAIPPKG